MFTATSNGATNFGSTPTVLVGLATVPTVVWIAELIGERRPEPSAAPMSHALASAAVMPDSTPLKLPARLSQNTSFNSVGLLNSVLARVDEPLNRVVLLNLACSGSLLAPVDRPAGAGWPLLVTAVAVVMFRATVLLTMFTKAASSRASPPPSWAETLLATVLLVMVIISGLARLMWLPLVCSNRRPPPSSLARLAWITLASIVTGPEPSDSCVGSAGSSPAIMTPPPSS